MAHNICFYSFLRKFYYLYKTIINLKTVRRYRIKQGVNIMRTIRTKVYTFDELSEQAKQVAIEEVRNEYYNYNNFANWAIDDCALFEPKEKELIELFGEDYNFPLIKNTRESIYFDTERNSFLDCEKAMQITNKNQFLLWLGIDVNIKGLDEIYFRIFTPNYRNADTTIDFDDYDSDFDDLILSAKKKFDNLIQDILKRIEQGIDYRFTDEAITEDILANEDEFLSNGKRYLYESNSRRK